MKTAVFTLPFPPSVNHYYGNLYGGDGKRNVYIRPEGMLFRKQTKEVIQKVGANNLYEDTDKIGIGLLVFPPDRRRRDLDNIEKALFDALTQSELWPDDSQVWYKTSKRKEVVKGGKVLVMCWEIKC